VLNRPPYRTPSSPTLTHAAAHAFGMSYGVMVEIFFGDQYVMPWLAAFADVVSASVLDFVTATFEMTRSATSATIQSNSDRFDPLVG
jgi:hypothetical protein